MDAKRGYAVAEVEPVVNNVEVLFLYIKRFKNLNEIQLNFSGEGFYKIEPTAESLILTYRENKKYPKSIFPIPMHNLIVEGGNQENGSKKINNVTAIIGQNGAGKSNILEYLKRILTNNLYVNEDSLIILKVDGVIKAYHSLIDKIELNEGLNIHLERAVENGNFIERYHMSAEKKTERHEILAIPHLTKSKVIFYSPQADIQNFPFNFDDPQYNDISTNYLLEYDQRKGEEYAKSKFDKILSHKSQTTRRFIDLIYSNLPLPEDVNTFIPKSTYVQINRLLSPESDSRNLNFHDKEFMKLFLNKLNENWNISHALKKEKKYIEGYIALLKTELSYSIMNHYFHNKEDEYEANSKIDNKDVDWGLSMEDIVRFYLSKQRWKSSDIYVLLFDSLINAIEASKDFSENADSYSFRVDQGVDLITLYSNYQNYEELFIDTNHPSGLLDFYWRGISSGEKTLMDLYARLLDTRRKNFANAGCSNPKPDQGIKNLFLLIDEGEIGFHPQWQKNYLKYLVDFLRYAYKDFNIQLILTSHSPFLISDLPRENVVFLKKEGENSIVCDPKKLNLTFGGNIHEMLIDSFFLEDGIIGAFAQDRINEVISEVLSEVPIKQERITELKYIIESIGEPIVRVKLLNLLAEKKLIDRI